jgi:hypothetical protein
MTGSFWAPIVIPIVAVIALAVWLAMVYHADAHPGWKAHSGAPSSGVGSTTAGADARKQTTRREAMTVARRDEDTGKLGDRDGGEPAAPPPSRRAA